MFYLERKTLQEPLSVQVDLNRGIKEGVDFKVTLTLKYGRYDKSNQSILFCINETNLERKRNKKMQKMKKGTNPPRGDGEWARKSLFREIFYYMLLEYQ